MKKIAFVTRSLRIGGTEVSLVNLLNKIPESEFSVTLFLTEKDLSLLPDIRREVNIEYVVPDPPNRRREILNFLKKGRFPTLVRYLSFLSSREQRTYRYRREAASVLAAGKSKEVFDLAVAYYIPSDRELLLTVEYVRAKKKAAWMHYDIAGMDESAMHLKPVYQRMDRIYCVSKNCKKSFCGVFPELSDKARVFYNILDEDRIRSGAREYAVEKNGYPLLFTCARISEEKNPLLAVQAAKELKKSFPSLRWYWAGGSNGNYRDKVQQCVDEAGLNENFFFTGALRNPYPYYKSCDVYVQTSDCESYCLSLAEAKLLSEKIVTTNFPTAYEILEGGEGSGEEIIEKTTEALVGGVLKALTEEKTSERKVNFASEEELKNFLNWIR